MSFDDLPLPDGPEISVSADGMTLWVTATDGSCIGRFSKRFGIDVHTTATSQLADAKQCLYCTHEPAGYEEWQVFREQMRLHHGVVVPNDGLTW